MTASEVLVLWAWLLASLFFAWQLGSLIGYWRLYGWPWTRKLRRWAARRHRKEAEAALAQWIGHHQEEVQRIENNIASVALLGMTFEEAADVFAALGRELNRRDVA